MNFILLMLMKSTQFSLLDGKSSTETEHYSFKQFFWLISKTFYFCCHLSKTNQVKIERKNRQGSMNFPSGIKIFLAFFILIAVFIETIINYRNHLILLSFYAALEFPVLFATLPIFSLAFFTCCFFVLWISLFGKETDSGK